MNPKLRNATTPHEIVRFDVDVHQAYDDFRQRYEAAVPMWDRQHAVELVQRKASWAEVVADAAARAPYEFLLYWKMDLTPLMSLAGNSWRCTEYLMGNHTIAETMYRHDPLVGLYVPLRTAIYAGADGEARFAIEQPSTSLVSLGSDEISRVGMDLDRKLARLLQALGAELPASLQSAA